MKKWLMAVLFGTLLVLGACGGGGDDDSSEPADDTGEDTEQAEESDDGGDAVANDEAEELYAQSCASCHGDDLSGAVGPDLTKVGSDHSSDDILQIIEDGQGSMPPGLLEGEDAQVVSDWLAEHK